jgi:hypothetical protein
MADSVYPVSGRTLRFLLQLGITVALYSLCGASAMGQQCPHTIDTMSSSNNCGDHWCESWICADCDVCDTKCTTDTVWCDCWGGWVRVGAAWSQPCGGCCVGMRMEPNDSESPIKKLDLGNRPMTPRGLLAGFLGMVLICPQLSGSFTEMTITLKGGERN